MSTNTVRTFVKRIVCNQYLYNSFSNIIQLSIKACNMAAVTIDRPNLSNLRLQHLASRSPVAFEQELIASHLTSFQNAKGEIESGMEWICRSEIESDNYYHVYNYLPMSKTIKDIDEEPDTTFGRITDYSKHYDPCPRVNN